MTIIFNALLRSSLTHPPLIKTPLVGRASARVARRATRFMFVHFYATAAIITTTFFIIAPHAFSLTAKRFPQLTVEPVSSRGLTQ